MRFRKSLIVSASALALVCGTLGCKKKDDQAGFQQGQPAPYGQQPGPYGQQQPGPYGQQPPPQQTAPQQTPQQPPPAAGGCTPGPASPMDPSAGQAVQPVLGQVAQSELPGSKAVGSALTGNFQPCQTIEAQATLQPGKCYVIVGAGAPPVSEVNVKLVAVTPLPGSTMVLAQDSDQGVQAVIGRKPNCYKNAFPMPVPVKVVLEVQAGSGVAAAQVYEK